MKLQVVAKHFYKITNCINCLKQFLMKLKMNKFEFELV